MYPSAGRALHTLGRKVGGGTCPQCPPPPVPPPLTVPVADRVYVSLGTAGTYPGYGPAVPRPRETSASRREGPMLQKKLKRLQVFFPDYWEAEPANKTLPGAALCNMGSQKWCCTQVEPIIVRHTTSTMAASMWCNTKTLVQLYIKNVSGTILYGVSIGLLWGSRTVYLVSLKNNIHSSGTEEHGSTDPYNM